MVLRGEFKTVDYDGKIYCYNVPNHLFITRRNGKIAIHGNTANRATSDNMSRNLVDSVKDIQRVLESQFTDFVINELLLESNFGSDVLSEKTAVKLKFKEIILLICSKRILFRMLKLVLAAEDSL
jgi:TATA-box binding protein (TBP) (component of TFIID and TFIIIB)